MKNAKNNRNRKSGFTLAELLVVVAIIMILAGVSFVAVIRYQKSLRRLEMDQTAKEIFLAAQNRLSLEKSNGTMERLLNGSFDSDEIKNKLGTKVEEKHRGAGTGEENSSSSEAGTESGSVGTGTGSNTNVTADATNLYCIRYTAKANSGLNENEDIRERLLPFGSIDDTVRIGGNYLIFYEPKNGSVRAVWYSDTYEFVENDYKGNALNEAAVSASKRESFTGTNSKFANHGCPVGYYGGARTEDDNRTDDTKLDSISLELKNEEVLYAVVTDPNISYPTRKYDLKLWIEGVDSGAKACVELTSSTVSSAVRYSKDIASQKYYWILDDITAKGTRFADLNTDLCLKWSDDTKKMIPGENVRVYAEIYAKGQTKPYQTTTVYQENSLFQDKKANGVTIANARHLENLDYRVSQFDPSAQNLEIQAVNDENNTGENCYVAEQLKDVSWTEFRENVAKVHGFGNDFTGLEKAETGVTPYYYRHNVSQEEGAETTQGCFLPVEPQFALYYKGNAFFAENLEIHPNQDTESAGLFGTVRNNLTVENLKLFYPVVTSKVSTGGLIGLGEENSKILVKDVIVQYPKVTAEGGSNNQTTSPPLDAGGIIGDFRGTQLTLDGCLVENQALVQVSGTAKAQDTKTLPEGVNPDALEVYADSSSAGGLLGSMTNGNLTVHSCAASVYVNAETYAGGLLGSVTTPGTVNIDSSYVGGHTNDGKMLSSPLPNDTNFAQTTGRYNIVSRKGAAGGLAAIVPTNTTIAHSYVTASVYADLTKSQTTDSGITEWGKESNADDSQQYAAFVRFMGDMSTANSGIKASECSYCYSIALVNGARAQVYSAELNTDFQAIMNGNANTGLFAFISAKKAFPYDDILGQTYPMLTVQELVKKDQKVTANAKKTLSRYVTVHIGDWMVPIKAKDSNFQVINGNRLTVRIDTGSTDPNANLDYVIKVHGESSNKDVYFRIQANGSSDVKISRSYPASSWTIEYSDPTLTNLYNNKTAGRFDFYLDNISQKDCRFGSIVPCSIDTFWPGEDITINVSSLNNDTEWSNISSMTFDENNAVLTNSCFGSIEKKPTDTDLVTEHNNQKIEKIKAALPAAAVTTGEDRGLITIDGNYYVQIDNSRHLQNLSSYISGGYGNDIYTKLAGAIQTDNIYWSGTSKSCTKSFTDELGADVKVYGASSAQNGWTAGEFYPIYLNDNRTNLAFAYVGSDCKISGLSIKGDSAAGLFGEVNSPFSAKNLTFENISVEGTDTGALVGNFSGNQITIQDLKLSTKGDNVQNIIKGNGCTGGFVGYATGEAEIKNSSINGKTEVTSIGSDWSAVAGGVIGSASNKINFDTVKFEAGVTVAANGYSGAKAGGFIGNVGSGSNAVQISNSAINGFAEITAKSGYAAGTIAYIDYNVTANIDNLRMEGNLNVIGKNATGGLVGFTQGSMLTISNSGLKTTSVNSTEGRAAGLVADTTSEVEIVGTQIDGRLTVNGKQETGGFVGNTTNKLSIKNSSVLDAAVTSSANKAGGLVGVTATSNDVTLSKVKVIGKNTEIRGYNSTGGLFGRLEAANININHAAVSAFICAKGNGSDTNANGGGLIGEIKTTGDSSILQNSYYGGRTKNGKYEIITLPYDGGSTGNTYESNIYGYQTAGGIIGWVDGVRNLSIQYCFSTGSVENAYKDKDVGLTAGGFIGAASQNDGILTMRNCYSMGKVNGNPNNQGGFVGYINRDNLSCKSGVYYLDVFNDDTLGIYGLYKNNTVKHNVTLSIDEISQSDNIEADTKAIAHSYDPTLPKQYPYLIWTQESAANDNTIIYYGDWPEINLDGAFVYYYPGSDENWNKTQEGYVTFYRYDGETLEAYLKKDSSSILEKIQKEESFGIMINSTTKYEQLVKMYTYKEKESSAYTVIDAFEGGNDYSAEYASVSYLGKKYYLYRITKPKGGNVIKLWIQHIMNYNDDDGTYTVDGEYQWDKNNTAWTKLN